MLRPGIGRASWFSKIAAFTAPLISTCPRCIALASVFQINGLVVAVELKRRRTLFLRPEAGILSAAERKLVFHAGARQVDGQQAGLGAIDKLEGPRQVGGLDRRRKAKRNVVGNPHGIFKIPGA